MPFKNCAVCYCFLIIRPPEYRFINEVYCLCFQSFCLLSILAEKLVYLKYERVLLCSNDRLIGFLTPSLSFFFFLKKLFLCHTFLSTALHIQHLNPYRTVCVGQRLDYSYLSLIVTKKVIVCFPMSVLKENKQLTVKLPIRYYEV